MQQAVLQILAGDPTYRDDGELSPLVYRQFLEASAMPIVVFERGDRGSLVQFVNRAFSKRTGYATEEVCGSTWWAMHKAPGNEQALAELWGAMCCGRELQIQLRSHCKDGSWFWSQLHLSPVSEHGEAPRYYMGVLRDISDEHNRFEDLEGPTNFDLHSSTSMASRASTIRLDIAPVTSCCERLELA